MRPILRRRMGTMKPINAYLTAFLKLTPGLIVIAMLASCHSSPTALTTITPGSPPADSSAAETARPTRTPVATATPSPTPTIAPPVSTLEVQAEQLSGLTVTFWHPWGGEQGSQLEGMLAEFNRTNQWGITVQTTAYNGLSWMEEAVEAAMSSGTLPDLLIAYDYQASHWDATNSALVDLEQYAADPSWGFSADEQADFFPAFWGQDVANQLSGASKRLGLPLHRSALVLYYNQSYAQALGFNTLPDTTYELRVRACAAAEANASDGQTSNDGTGGWLITPHPSLLVGWIYAFGGEITRPDGRGYQFDTPEAGQALDYIKGLQDSGCAFQAVGADPATEFAARRTLFFAGSLADLPAVEAAFAAAGNRDDWTVLPFPGSGSAPVLVTYGPALSITRSTTEGELAAWLVAEWLVYPPNQAKWVAENQLLPVRQSTLGYLDGARQENPQWGAALELLPLARSEPGYASWSVMRWALNDALAELFDPTFTSGQIPDLLEALEQTALDIHTQVR